MSVDVDRIGELIAKLDNGGLDEETYVSIIEGAEPNEIMALSRLCSILTLRNIRKLSDRVEKASEDIDSLTKKYEENKICSQAQIAKTHTLYLLFGIVITIISWHMISSSTISMGDADFILSAITGIVSIVLATFGAKALTR